MESIFAQPDDSLYQSLPKAAARFALSIVRSGQYLTDAYADALLGLLTADNLWTLCLILAAWAIATVVGGPLAIAVDGLLIAYGIYSLYEQLAATWSGLRRWAEAAYKAASDEQLDVAARDFAATVAAGSLELLAVVLTHKVFVKVNTTLGRRFPRPTWLEEELASAKQKRARRQTGEASDASKVRSEKAGQPRVPEDVRNEPARSEPARSEPSRVRSLTESTLSLGRAAGARQMSQSSLTVPAWILGGTVALGVAAAVTAAAIGGSRGRKK